MMSKFSSKPAEYNVWSDLEKKFYDQEIDKIQVKHRNKTEIYTKWSAILADEPADEYVKERCDLLQSEILKLRSEKQNLIDCIEVIKGWINYHEFNGFMFLRNSFESPYYFKVFSANDISRESCESMVMDAPVEFGDIHKKDGIIVLYKTSTGEPRDGECEQCGHPLEPSFWNSIMSNVF